jgi:deoxyribose-phosphate aldolase
MKIENETLTNIGRMIDVSAVRTDVTMEDIDKMIEIVKKYNCICASPMPWATSYTIERLSDTPETLVTGVVAFPAGAETTFIKVATAKEMISLGCKELDMVINVSALKSGLYGLVESDIRAVVDAANGIPVKTILEICYLNDDEIRRGAEIGIKAGATYIKTGTGWGPKPTTVDTVRLIRSAIGNAGLIKVAGGIHDLDTLLAMADAGCDRFGIGVRSALKIFRVAYERAGMGTLNSIEGESDIDNY